MMMAPTRLRLDELMYAWVADPDTPLQIGLLCVFDAGPFRCADGGLDAARIRAEFVARAAQVAGLRRRVVWTRLGEGRPFWAVDPAFDAASHVAVTVLPTGADVSSWAAQRAARPLERDRPSWRAEIVTGLPSGRFAVLVVVSHILADGRAGVALVAELLDPRADARTPSIEVKPAPPLPSHRQLMRERLHAPRGQPRRRLRGSGGVRQARAAAASLRKREPTTSLPRRIGPTRRLGVVREPLPEPQGCGHERGVTVNDLLLAAVTGGLRELLVARGENTPGLVLRASIPAATRSDRQVTGMIVVGLPVGEPDPDRRLALIHGATATGKAALRDAGGADLRLPTPLARWVFRWARRTGSRRLTLAVADVPGPRQPLWLAGARLLEAVPIAPLSSGVPLSIAALSYVDTLVISVNADAALTDLDVLTDGIARTFTELRDHAGRPR